MPKTLSRTLMEKTLTEEESVLSTQEAAAEAVDGVTLVEIAIVDLAEAEGGRPAQGLAIASASRTSPPRPPGRT